MGRHRILIVDDDPVIRDVLSSMVCSLGDYQTDSAADGVEGLTKVREGQYDIVFTDIKMPRMGGLEFIREVKKSLSRVPIVVITAYAYIETAISAMKEGAADFITKPFKAGDIKFVLNRIEHDNEIIKTCKGAGDSAKLLETENASLYEKLREISLLHSIFSELDEITDNKELFTRCVALSAKLMKVKEVSFGLIENGMVSIIKTLGMDENRVPVRDVLAEIIENKKHKILDVGKRNPLTFTNLDSQMMILPLILKQDVFGIFSIGRKTSGYDFTEEEINLALTFIRKLSMKIENNALYDIFYNNLLNTLKSLIMTIEARDSYTKIHSERVTMIAVEIARMLECTAEEIDSLKFGGYLHDIGKIGVRDTVLLKPSRLTEEEFVEIRLHPVIGDNIIKPLGSFPNERLIVRHHHERFDGKGYPDGLGGTDIPRTARILAVADTYDSMTSTRPYRQALSHATAIEELKRCSGTQFDPAIVEAFLQTGTGRGQIHDAA